jgi:hypothetical protein
LDQPGWQRQVKCILTSAPFDDPISTFKKGIKRDATLFIPYKDEKHCDVWRRSTLAQARAQGVEEIMDATYSPSTMDEKALFMEKQKYMYAVFECTLQTDQGKALV